jgi:hypothetical protein
MASKYDSTEYRTIVGIAGGALACAWALSDIGPSWEPRANWNFGADGRVILVEGAAGNGMAVDCNRWIDSLERRGYGIRRIVRDVRIAAVEERNRSLAAAAL